VKSKSYIAFGLSGCSNDAMWPGLAGVPDDADFRVLVRFGQQCYFRVADDPPKERDRYSSPVGSRVVMTVAPPDSV
jgi:hypothetical protein